MLSLSDNYQADVYEAFNSTSTYLYDLLYIDRPYFELMVSPIYPIEFQLNKVFSIHKTLLGLRRVHYNRYSFN